MISLMFSIYDFFFFLMLEKHRVRSPNTGVVETGKKGRETSGRASERRNHLS